MSNVTRSLHRRFNRNHSPKCLSWDGSNNTSKVVCTDSNRSIRKANDWTLACLINQNQNTLATLPCLYSDYENQAGIFIGLDNITSTSVTSLRIIDRFLDDDIVFNLSRLYNQEDWLSIVVSYDSINNFITVFENGNSLGGQTYLNTSEWALSTSFGIYSIPSTFANFQFEGLHSSYCILDKQADNDFTESFNKFGLPDEGSFPNVTFFTDLSKVNDQGTYTGLECSTKFFNPNSTTKEIEFVGWTDEQLGLDIETNGISSNCLMKEFYSGGSPYEVNTQSIVVEKDSGFQPRRNGLKFEASKKQYLKISGMPQIDTTEGFTLLVSVKEISSASSRVFVWFTTSNTVDDKLYCVYRVGSNPPSDNVIGLCSGNVNAQRESQFQGIDGSYLLNLQMRGTNEKIINPLNQSKRIDKVNNETIAKDNFIYRGVDTTYDLYVGGTPSGLNLVSEQYTDMTLESLILVRGILQDSEIQEIMGVGKLNNVPLSLQEKYDFDLILDLNKDTYYDDNGTLKLKDLSGNNRQVEAISENGLGWQTLTDLGNSATQL